MCRFGLKIGPDLPIGSRMIGAVALKLQAQQLDHAREALSTAQQVSAQSGAAAAPEVILELSAEAQKLLSASL
jgi:hypothetical protein